MSKIANLETHQFSRWEKNTRYYQAILQTDLFGWVVIKRWGGIGKSNGQQHTTPYPNYQAAQLEFHHVALKRKKRGYTLTITRQHTNPG